MSKWENNCNETWVGNMHRWEDKGNNTLSLWKRIIGKTLYRCKKCGKQVEGYHGSSASDWGY